MDYFLLLVGFILLIKGADYFVEGCASIAKSFKVPSFIIGMTIVAMGTSAPECAVSVTSSLKGANELAISNVTGSNIFNLMVVCGICALIVPLTIDTKTLKREFPFSIIAALLLLGLGYVGGVVGHVDGIILLVVFAGFLTWMVLSAKKQMTLAKEHEEDEEYKVLPLYKSIFFIFAGAIAIMGGGDLVVDSASNIAAHFGMSQTLIGLTIVACGTSLPELVTSVVAAKKNEVDMALGNVIGSNIFNVLLIIGVAGAISSVSITLFNMIDLIVLTGMSLLVFLFTCKKHYLSRWNGAIMLLIYVGYIAYTVVR